MISTNRIIRHARLLAANPKAYITISRVKKQRLTFLDRDSLCDLVDVAARNERRRLDGAIFEMGCALGGSAIVLARVKSRARQMMVYDVFGLIPPPSELDGPDVHNRYNEIVIGKAEGIGGDKYYGYEDNLYEKVYSSFITHRVDPAKYNVRFVQGLFSKTLNPDGPISLAHIDCDWYDSVMTCLDRIYPRLVSGGTMVIDDYDTWSGCRSAVDRYFAGVPSEQFHFFYKSHLHIVKS